MTASIPIENLGQSGCRLAFHGTTVYMDPYLSNSVQICDSPDLARLRPIPCLPGEIADADWVLITHEHIDHCDPHTLPELAAASPQARFMGPPPVLGHLRAWGIEECRLVPAEETWLPLGGHLSVRALPAAHPAIARNERGQLACVGYLLEYRGQRIYLAGDTSVTEELLDALKAHGPIHTAFLPVNEHNFFRGRRGIIGNMTIREAFLLAGEVGIRQVIPVHWDMFAVNSAQPEEIEAVYRAMQPDFRLLLKPDRIEL